MFRAVGMFRWAGAASLVAGLALVVSGVTRAEPGVDRFSVAIVAIIVLGVLYVVRRLLRLVAHATVVVAHEASAARRVLQIAMVCGAPALVAASGLLFPTHHTWLLGIAFALLGVVQLAFAVRIKRSEGERGALMLQDAHQRLFYAQ